MAENKVREKQDFSGQLALLYASVGALIGFFIGVAIMLVIFMWPIL